MSRYVSILLFSSAVLLNAQIPNRYTDEVFTNVTEENNVIFSTSVPKPKPDLSNLVVALRGPLIAVLEHDTENVSLAMDIFQPTGDAVAKRPLIIICFGGGFVQGSRDFWSMRLLAQGLARRGYVTATIDYRLGMTLNDKNLGSRAVYRAVQDSRSAVRFFKANAAQYKIDIDHIFIGGHSAGAFVALHNLYLDKDSERPNATRDTLQYGIPIPDLSCLDCVGDNLTYDGQASGVFSLAGAVGDLDYIEPTSDPGPILFHAENDGTVPYGIGEPFSDLSSNPFLNFHLPTVYGSQLIEERCQILGIPVEFNSYASRGHGVHENTGMTLHGEILPAIADWFYEQHLKPETPALQGSERLCVSESSQNYAIERADFEYFAWQVTGGSISSGGSQDNEVTIIWNEVAPVHNLEVLPYLENGAPGELRSISPEVITTAINSWTGTDGNWDDGENWSTGFAPLSCEEVQVPEGVEIVIASNEIYEIESLILNPDAELRILSPAELRISGN